MNVGLCETCRFRRVVTTARSTFMLCERSKDDERYRKYPRLPVISCPGFERATP